MIRSTVLALGAVAFLFCGCYSGPPRVADAIYHGGPILTMDGEQPSYAQAVAIAEGKILFVGDESLAMKYANKETAVYNLEGKTLLPGFIDLHSYFMLALDRVSQVNVASPPIGPVVSIPTLVAALEEYEGRNHIPEGSWIIGWGYDEEGLAEERHVTKEDLDEAFPQHKVILVHVSGKGGVLNSLALDAAGIDENTRTPTGSLIARHEKTGEPSGLVMGTVFEPILDRVPKRRKTERLKLVEPAQRLYASHGYTHVQEGYAFLEELHFLKVAAKRGLIHLDLSVLLTAEEADTWMGDTRYLFGEYVQGFKIQGFKIPYDTKVPTKERFLFTPEMIGHAPDPEEELDESEGGVHLERFELLLKEAYEQGVPVYIEVSGPKSIDNILPSVERARALAGSQRTIVLTPAQEIGQLDRFQSLGLLPSYLTNYSYFYGGAFEEGEVPTFSPLDSAGARGVIASSYTNAFPLDPFFLVWSAATRETKEGKALGTDQRIRAYTVLQSITSHAAYQLSEENRKGRIKEGLIADFCIVSGDPLEIDLSEVRDLEVVETIKRGKTIYKKAPLQEVSQ